MNRKLTTVLLAGLALGAAMPAMAEETKPMGLSIRAGVFFPSSGVAKAAGNTWFGGGLDYKIETKVKGPKVEGMSTGFSLSADYLSKSSLHLIPVMVNYVASQNQVFYEAGIGAAFTNDGIENKTQFGYQLGLGYNLSQMKMPIFIEAKYFGTTGSSQFNGFAVFLGIRL
jgi:hypothetical protein